MICEMCLPLESSFSSYLYMYSIPLGCFDEKTTFFFFIFRETMVKYDKHQMITMLNCVVMCGGGRLTQKKKSKNRNAMNYKFFCTYILIKKKNGTNTRYFISNLENYIRVQINSHSEIGPHYLNLFLDWCVVSGYPLWPVADIGCLRCRGQK